MVLFDYVPIRSFNIHKSPRGRSASLPALISPSPLRFQPARTARIPPISHLSHPKSIHKKNITMAKLAIATAAAALFCLFTVSLARPPPRLTADSSDPALRLPTEPIKADDAEADPNFAVVSAVPLTEITFRPVNRRFHVKRPCRGRHRHHFKLHPAMMRKSEPIPFANDVIGENSDFEQPIPTRWTRVRNHHLRHRHRRREDSDGEEGEEDENRAVKRAVFKRFNYDRFDREKRMKKLRQRLRIGNERKEEDEMPGFVKGVRKFLTNYF